MSDPKLIVMRHGETDFNREGRYQGSIDTRLNDKGREQARRAVERLAAQRIDAVVTSPLDRARETASIVAAALELPITEKAAFVERRYGIFEGLTREEIMERHPDSWHKGINRQMHAGPPQGESLLELAVRVRQGLVDLIAEFGGRTILLVCHGGVARAIHGILRRPFDDEFFSYVLDNGAIDVYRPPLHVDSAPQVPGDKSLE